MKHSKKNIIIFSALFGLIVGVLYNLIQSLLGMSPLADHVKNYLYLSDISENTALLIAWSVHLFVSLCYGLIIGLLSLMIKKRVYFFLITAFLGWIAAVFFPVVNNLIIKIISYMSWPSFDRLPDYNFSLDEQLISHLLFLLTIAVLILISDMKMQKKHIGNHHNEEIKLEETTDIPKHFKMQTIIDAKKILKGRHDVYDLQTEYLKWVANQKKSPKKGYEADFISFCKERMPKEYFSS